MMIARQLVLYFAFGLTQFVVDTAVLLLLTNADVPIAPANLMSRAFAAVLGFVLNYSLTFKRGGVGSIRGPVVLRHVVAWVSLTLTSTALVSLGAGLRPEATDPTHWLAAVKIGVEGALFFVSFTVARYWVFRAPSAR
ncbi:MAG: GtrA family protein [Burkholderiales bacterium]